MIDVTQFGGHGSISAEFAAQDPEVETLRTDLFSALCALGDTISSAMDSIEGFIPCEHAFGIVIDGLYIASISTDKEELQSLKDAVVARAEHVADHRQVPQSTLSFDESRDSYDASLVVTLRGLATVAHRAMNVGIMDQELNVFLVRALRALGKHEVTHELLMQASDMCLRAEKRS